MYVDMWTELKFQLIDVMANSHSSPVNLPTTDRCAISMKRLTPDKMSIFLIFSINFAFF